MRSLIIRPIQAGFTLVELLIVVIIIAILAAIIVPQFSSATRDAQEAALDANLSAMRSAIELYRAQHTGVYPGFNASSGGPACTTGGTLGLAAGGSAAAFTDQLLTYSTASGATCTIGDATNYRFGPYFRKGIPSDISPTPSATVAVQTGGAPLVTGTGATATCSSCTTAGGWNYNFTTGQIVMNNTTNDSKSNPFFTH
jgi:prepilin-type N-terminal cleavage/methylation domain-containing protein